MRRIGWARPNPSGRWSRCAPISSRLGLARLARADVYEDHLAALLETMRVLVLGVAERPPGSLAQQKAFFDRHLGPWVDDCCNAINRSTVANYYRCVAELTQALVAIERDAFAIA